MQFQKNNNNESVSGYIDYNGGSSFMFPATRVISMKVFNHNGKHYVRTRDAADLLGMKQPFQFTAYCKEYLGENAILKSLVRNPISFS